MNIILLCIFFGRLKGDQILSVFRFLLALAKVLLAKGAEFEIEAVATSRINGQTPLLTETN